MSTYLVTGAAGFIASKVCEQLLAAGHTVVGVDNLNDYYDVRLKDYRLGVLLGDERWRRGTNPERSLFLQGGPFRRKQFSFYPVDIENRAALEVLFADFAFDAVFNLAARAGVRASIENPHVFLSTNTVGTLNLLECQRRFGVKKHVLASTSSLYAGCPTPSHEDQAVNTPISPYAVSKRAAELMAYCYHVQHGIDATVVRYFTVFGPAGRPDMSIFRFIRWVDEGRPIELFGDGTQSRDFTYIDDIARGTILAAKPLGFETINLGGGRKPMSLNAIIAVIEETLGTKAAIDRKPAFSSDVMESWADIAKADRLLGWRPTTTPADGVRQAIEWYVENRAWLRRIQL